MQRVGRASPSGSALLSEVRHGANQRSWESSANRLAHTDPLLNIGLLNFPPKIARWMSAVRTLQHKLPARDPGRL